MHIGEGGDGILTFTHPTHNSGTYISSYRLHYLAGVDIISLRPTRTPHQHKDKQAERAAYGYFVPHLNTRTINFKIDTKKIQKIQ